MSMDKPGGGFDVSDSVFVLVSLMASGVSSGLGAGGLGAGRRNRSSTDAAGAPTAPRLTHADERAAEASRCRGLAPSLHRRPRSGISVSDLNVQYTEGQALESGRDRFDTVKLRSYVGNGVNPETPFIGPRIDMCSGRDGAHGPCTTSCRRSDLHRSAAAASTSRTASTAPTCIPWICGSIRRATATTC